MIEKAITPNVRRPFAWAISPFINDQTNQVSIPKNKKIASIIVFPFLGHVQTARRSTDLDDPDDPIFHAQ